MILIVPFFWYGNNYGVLPQLRDCAIIQGSLEQHLYDASQLLGTVPQGTTTDVIWASCCVDFCLLEGSHHIVCVNGEGGVARFEFGDGLNELNAVICLKSSEKGIEVIR